jgi:hypothetical protein
MKAGSDRCFAPGIGIAGMERKAEMRGSIELMMAAEEIGADIQPIGIGSFTDQLDIDFDLHMFSVPKMA